LAGLSDWSAIGDLSSDQDANSRLVVSGVLTPVITIQRLNTKGGNAPVTGCDAQHSGTEVRAAYTADYIFYVPK